MKRADTMTELKIGRKPRFGLTHPDLSIWSDEMAIPKLRLTKVILQAVQNTIHRVSTETEANAKAAG
ncbi:hypothetical protein QUF72_13375 [Desulfobacterales bacterium HSG2]|nr:hypothetical protein [Desulfobacterales bacterium HSG2]